MKTKEDIEYILGLIKEVNGKHSENTAFHVCYDFNNTEKFYTLIVTSSLFNIKITKNYISNINESFTAVYKELLTILIENYAKEN